MRFLFSLSQKVSLRVSQIQIQGQPAAIRASAKADRAHGRRTSRLRSQKDRAGKDSTARRYESRTKPLQVDFVRR